MDDGNITHGSVTRNQAHAAALSRFSVAKREMLAAIREFNKAKKELQKFDKVGAFRPPDPEVDPGPYRFPG